MREDSRPEGHAQAGRLWHAVAPAFHRERLHEVLVEVLGVLGHAVLERAADADEVERGEVLHVLAEADASRVRAHRNVEVIGEEDRGDHLVHAAEAAAVDLQHVDRARLQELLHHDAVVTVLAGRDADRADRAGDARVAEDVVRARRLLDPPEIVGCELRDALDGLVDVPDLVRVDHQLARGADLLAQDRAAARVVPRIAAHLDLEVGPAVGDRAAAALPDRRLVVAEPAGRGDVGGEPSLRSDASRAAAPSACAWSRSSAASGGSTSAM